MYVRVLDKENAWREYDNVDGYETSVEEGIPVVQVVTHGPKAGQVNDVATVFWPSVVEMYTKKPAA